MKPSKYNYFVKYDEKKYLLCNTFSKAIVQIPNKLNDEVSKILNGIPSDNEIVFKILSNNGFIIDDNIDELSLIQEQIADSKENPHAFNITMFPTLNCNFRCSYCYQEHIAQRTSYEKLDSVIEFIKENIKGKKFLVVNWFGGEPLLETEKIIYFNGRLRKELPDIKLYSNMVTNGYLLNEKNSDVLINGAGIKHFQITIDGNKETHDKARYLYAGNNENAKTETFDKIFSNIRFLVNEYHDKIKIVLRINYNLQMKDIDLGFLDELVNEKGLNCCKVSIHPIHNNPAENPGLYEKETEVLSKQIISLKKKIKDMGFEVNDWFFSSRYNDCAADVKDSYYILPDGSETFCTGLDFKEENIIGYIDETGKHERIKDSKKSWIESSSVDEKCKECKLFPICMGGCAYIKNEKKQLPCMFEKVNTDEHFKLLL